jgi:hypothetical protein
VTYGRPARTSPPIRVRWLRVTGLLVVLAALAVGFGDEWPSSSPTTSTASTPSPAHRGLGEAGGDVPDGTSVFDDDVPGVANLDPALLRALRRAATAAADAGVGFVVNSGWRSEAYQEHLLDEAIGKYGSRAEASRWVAPPDRSEHVSGHAVDIGPTAAAAWLSAHGAAYGLCRIYANEPWHFERRPDAVRDGCPALYADAAHDPRLQG